MKRARVGKKRNRRELATKPRILPDFEVESPVSGMVILDHARAGRSAAAPVQLPSRKLLLSR